MRKLTLLMVMAVTVGGAIAHVGAAETPRLRIARQYGIGYLQMMVMEHEHLIEKEARARGVPAVSFTWTTFADGTGATDAILSGNLDIAAGGLGSFVTLWGRTVNGLGVKGIAALNSMPMLLTSRDPRIRNIRDLGERDRIAVAGVKVSSQATTLQYAATQAFGPAAWNRLDHLTVNMGHPTGMQLMLQRGGDIALHFASPPYQYQELANPGVHTVLDSYDVWGGPQTFALVWTTSRFRSDNPELYCAFVAALKDATERVRRDKRAAAAIYIEMSGDRRMSVDDLAAMLAKPELRFTLAPENVLRFALFKADIGMSSVRPASWKEMFFPEIHSLPGS
ncbi:MAG: ABC transporter substrate-binding protein [Casimicrobiaceae bacterium]